eukprot:SAG11_NODE_6980_length_1215_cov_1.403226_1_plen_91_part_00
MHVFVSAGEPMRLAQLDASLLNVSQDIPAQERWVSRAYWEDGTLNAPQVMLDEMAAGFRADYDASRKLEASAASIIDRYKGFANIKGLVD